MKGRHQGFTLIELVISMTLIAISILGTLLAINTTALFSADPLITYQAVAIAESYLEEIVKKDFPINPCPAGVRSTFSNICNYQGLSEPPTDQTGTPIAGLGGYTVNVNVDNTLASLGAPSLTPGIQMVRIDIKIAHSSMPTMNFSVYRTNY